MRRLTWLALLATTLVLLALVLAACGGDGDDTDDTAPSGPSQPNETLILPTAEEGRRPDWPTYEPTSTPRTGAVRPTETPRAADTSPSATLVPVPPVGTLEPNTPAPDLAIDADPRTQAQLRIVNAISDPSMAFAKMFLNGRLVDSIESGDIIELTQIAAGDFVLQVTPGGRGLEATLHTYDFSLAPSENVILVVTGDQEDLRVLAYQQDLLSPDALDVDIPLTSGVTIQPAGNTASRASGVSQVAVMNAVPDSAPFELSAGDEWTLEANDFGTTSDLQDVPAGDYIVTAKRGETQLVTDDISLEEDVAYLLVVAANPEGTPFRLITVDTPLNPETVVRFTSTALLPDGVDIYIDDELVAENLGYRSSTIWMTYPSFVHDVRVMPAGAPDDGQVEPLYERTLNLAPEVGLELVLYDRTDDQVDLVMATADLSPTPRNGFAIRFVNTSLARSRVAISSPGREQSGIPAIGFSAASEPRIESANTSAYSFTDPDSAFGDTVDRLEERAWEAGYVYTVVVTGYPLEEPMVLERAVGISETTLIGESGLVTLDDTPAERDTLDVRVVNALADGRQVSLVIDVPTSEDAEPERREL
ncbi:MAG: DUF4397 domain-containing protein, partial [Chloroflexi bacterium]|nr:DUF4397 domain-containing protein [Chloroflexota bacterium]